MVYMLEQDHAMPLRAFPNLEVLKSGMSHQGQDLGVTPNKNRSPTGTGLFRQIIKTRRQNSKHNTNSNINGIQQHSNLEMSGREM